MGTSKDWVKASKAEEVAELKKLVAKYPRESYLGSLLTDELVTWFEGQVRDDFAPDAVGVMNHYVKLFSDAQAERLSAERDAATAASSTRLSWYEVTMHMAGQFSKERLNKDLYKWQRDGAREELREARGEVVDLRNRLGDAWLRDQELKSKVTELEEEVLRLKAKMFDMMTGSDAGDVEQARLDEELERERRAEMKYDPVLLGENRDAYGFEHCSPDESEWEE